MKTIANRLKWVREQVISNNQSAFVLGQHISGNVIVAFELMHMLRAKSNGSKGWLALKLDLRKAYNSVKGGFLKAMMIKLGFADRWVKLIMKCVTTAHFLCLINGRPFCEVTPQRG